MKSLPAIGAGILCLAHFFVPPPAAAAEREDGSALEWATDIRGVDLKGLVTVFRVVEENFPVGAQAKLFVANQYGNVHVRPWDDPVISIVARISVGAEEYALADEFARAVDIATALTGNRLEVRTVYPDTLGVGQIGYVVDYTISVPRESGVVIENFFGDTLVRGLDGEATIDSRYGVIELRDIAGEVHVKAKGEFPLLASGLRQGGTFFLRSTQAEFEHVSGILNVNNYLGSVQLRSPGDFADIDVTAESGEIVYYVGEEARPSIVAFAEYGAIESNMLLEREIWGKSMRARLPDDESAQRVALHTTFNKIRIVREGLQAAPEPLMDANAKPITGRIEQSYPVENGDALEIAAIAGSVHITGGEEERVTVTANQSVRVAALQNAQRALEGLGLRVAPAPEGLRVETVLQEDMEALGCTTYTIDLELRIPHDMPIRIVAEHGDTRVANVRGPVVVEQMQGYIAVRDGEGELRLSNRSGNIEVENFDGRVNAVAHDGSVTGRNVSGDLDINATHGNAIVDAPGAGVVVRGTGGDVRVIATQGVRGNFDIKVEDGDISMAVPATANATFWMNAQGGAVYSAIPVTGSMDRAVQRFQGQMNGGLHRVMLSARRGDIVLD